MGGLLCPGFGMSCQTLAVSGVNILDAIQSGFLSRFRVPTRLTIDARCNLGILHE